MSETQQSSNETTNQFNSGTFNEVIDNLSGLNKWIANKIMNSDFKAEVNKILSSSAGSTARNALKSTVETATQNAAGAIGVKLAIIPIIILCVLAIPVIIVTLIGGGNIVIPIIAAVILIVIVRLAAGIVSKMAARKASNIVFKAIDDKISSLNINRAG